MTFKIGETYEGFTLKRHEKNDEIKADVYLFHHDLLECPLLAIKNEDPNKTFSIAFNTVPTDSTGVAHILEHSVLMGSEKYPVKDVFGEINKGGLMTFLNAMTGSDVTYYPFATRNLKEYYNIMGVYCDVVFNPLLLQTTFEQEGWHYHRESEESPLEFQGVVYNEMKGAFSDPVRLIFHHIFNGLMPESTYSHESGGDPKNIPDLTYEDFCAFHKEHYHPSNGLFYVYGNAPLLDELKYLQDNYLSTFQEKGQRSSIVPGNEVTKPVFIDDTYGVDSRETKEKTFLAVGTQVATVENRLQNAAFQVIANILFNSDGSPLKNSIVSSGMCKDFGGFYLSSSSFKTFMISYLVGSEKEHRDDFLQLYRTTLTDMVEKGLEHDLVLSELNKYEFNLREDASKSQRGLDLISKAMAAQKYGTDPFVNLVSEELISKLRHKALNEGYFEQLIRDFLLDNGSTVTVTLSPDPEKPEATRQSEQQRLDDYNNTLSKEEQQQLIGRTQELMKQQLEPNDVETLSLLPQLSRSDLSPQVDFYEIQEQKLFGCNALLNELPTNHISYLDLGFDIRCIPPHLLPYLDLFGTIATEIGTKKHDYMAFAKEVATYTGSFSHSLNTYTKKNSPETIKPIFWLHLKCLPTYLEKALSLAAEVLSDLSFENRTRIREIVGREFAWAEHSAQSEGYNLAVSRVFSHLSLAGRYSEMFSGVTSYMAVKELALNYSEKEELFLSYLQEICTTLFNRNNLLMVATADSSELEVLSKVGQCLPDALATTPVSMHTLPKTNQVEHEAFITSAEVVFAVQGGNLLENSSSYNGHFEVLKTYLSRDYLWNSVRQMGGAYGCFIQFSQITGNLAYISYRDPQVRKTYEAYNNVANVVATLDIPDKVLEQLVIGTYGNFDPHQSAAAKGATARNEYLSGITKEFKQKRISEILSTTVTDMKAFADDFARMTPGCHRAIIGNRAKIEKDKDLFTQLTEL
ncbi:insulinase family protein [Desulfopila sp. IMCC35008]|uniref:insulinase family protein n=1 Tax=Desulfopila sp. IMCC35008 TaxID=2653858 RepID=UPI0013D85B0C|nr:insulinase family protein [Desulfopila sp. IMCC35008]